MKSTQTNSTPTTLHAQVSSDPNVSYPFILGDCRNCCETQISIYSGCAPGTEIDAACVECWAYILHEQLHENTALFLSHQLKCCILPKCKGLIHPKLILQRMKTATRERIDYLLATIPATTVVCTNPPRSPADFKYQYNQAGHLEHCESKEPYCYISERHYSALGDTIILELQQILIQQYKFNEIWLPFRNTTMTVNEIDSHLDQVNIFVSSDFYTNTNGCLILIQGSGAVRPPQWARAICINDSLEIGTMFPYINKAQAMGYSCIILNPNQNTFVQVDPAEKARVDQLNVVKDRVAVVRFYLSSLRKVPTRYKQTKVAKIPLNETGRAHALYVFDHVLSQCPAANLLMVAHSAGGDAAMTLLRQRSAQVLQRLRAVAFTDSVHSLLPADSKPLKTFLQQHGIHFVASALPLDTPIVITAKNKWAMIKTGLSALFVNQQPPACKEVSAGHTKHEYTSGCAMESVFKFFQQQLSV